MIYTVGIVTLALMAFPVGLLCYAMHGCLRELDGCQRELDAWRQDLDKWMPHDPLADD